MSRSASDQLQRRTQLKEEINGLEFSLSQFQRYMPDALATSTLATKLRAARAEKEAIDADLQRLLGLH